jgi:hypothetical protein
VNATPMSEALLPISDSITLLDQEYDHQTNHRSVPMDFKARQLAVCLWMVLNYRTCAQSETTLHCTRRRLRSQAIGPLIE